MQEAMNRRTENESNDVVGALRRGVDENYYYVVAPQRRALRRFRERARKRRDLAVFPQTAMSHQRRRPAFEVSIKTHEQFGPGHMRSRSIGNERTCWTIRYAITDAI